MKAMTSDLRKKIEAKIKNKQDISDLIRDIDIKGENLAGAIIEYLQLVGRDVTNTNFSRAIIGRKGEIINWCSSRFKGCNFKDAVFKGKLWARRSDMRNCNFSGASIPFFEYQRADLRGCRFCSTIICVGSRAGMGAKFDETFFDELARYWDINVDFVKKGV